MERVSHISSRFSCASKGLWTYSGASVRHKHIQAKERRINRRGHDVTSQFRALLLVINFMFPWICRCRLFEMMLRHVERTESTASTAVTLRIRRRKLGISCSLLHCDARVRLEPELGWRNAWAAYEKDYAVTTFKAAMFCTRCNEMYTESRFFELLPYHRHRVVFADQIMNRMKNGHGIDWNNNTLHLNNKRCFVPVTCNTQMRGSAFWLHVVVRVCYIHKHVGFIAINNCNFDAAAEKHIWPTASCAVSLRCSRLYNPRFSAYINTIDIIGSIALHRDLFIRDYTGNVNRFGPVCFDAHSLVFVCPWMLCLVRAHARSPRIWVCSATIRKEDTKWQC